MSWQNGTGILLSKSGTAQLGLMKTDGWGFSVEKEVNREMNFGHMPGFRLLLKGSLVEFYLNDILIECFSLPDTATGRIGLIGRDSAETFQAITAWNRNRILRRPLSFLFGQYEASPWAG